MTQPKAMFGLEEAQAAADTWGANCGPGAIAAALDATLEDIRPDLGDFETKHYINPMLMKRILDGIGIKYKLYTNGWFYPDNGLARVQWEGPWTEPGQHWAARQRHTHWIATRRDDKNLIWIFDINCICVGGWVSFLEWEKQVVPWLLRKCEPYANGKWHPTHMIELVGIKQQKQYLELDEFRGMSPEKYRKLFMNDFSVFDSEGEEHA